MSYNKKPEMILFDVGGTLFKGTRCIPRDGLSALRKCALNPEVTDDDTLAQLWDEFAEEIGSGHKSKSGTSLDFHLSTSLKYITMKAGLRFDISLYEQEEIFDRYNSDRKLIPGINELLETINSLGIRMAVISNNAMSGGGLSLAVDTWLPSNKMEFCLTSADVLLTKPDKSIFICAANYAHLDPSDCWYCGDSKVPDVDGAKGAGMTPVLIDVNSEIPMEFRDGDYMTVNNWIHLAEHLKKICNK